MREVFISLAVGFGVAGLLAAILVVPAVTVLLCVPVVVASVALGVTSAVRTVGPADARRLAALGGVVLAAPPTLAALQLVPKPGFYPGPTAFGFGCLLAVTALVDASMRRGWPGWAPVERAVRAGLAGTLVAGAILVLAQVMLATPLALGIPATTSVGTRVLLALLFVPPLLLAAAVYALGVRRGTPPERREGSRRRIAVVVGAALALVVAAVVVTPAGRGRVGVVQLLAIRTAAALAVAPGLFTLGWLPPSLETEA